MRAYIECRKCKGQYMLNNVDGRVMCPKCKKKGGPYKIAMGSEFMAVPDWFIAKGGASIISILQNK